MSELDDFLDFRPCAELNCTQTMAPMIQRSMTFLAYTSKGVGYATFRRWMCAGGHKFMLEDVEVTEDGVQQREVEPHRGKDQQG